MPPTDLNLTLTANITLWEKSDKRKYRKHNTKAGSLQFQCTYSVKFTSIKTLLSHERKFGLETGL